MKEFIVLKRVIDEKGLRRSKQRDLILAVFLGIERHVTIDELWVEVKKRNPSVGYATVYRAMKLFCESGLCSEVRLENGSTLYEHLLNHEHHDHLICTRCGKMIEVINKEIEHLQEQLMNGYGFTPQFHRMSLYGICPNCGPKE